MNIQTLSETLHIAPPDGIVHMLAFAQ